MLLDIAPFKAHQHVVEAGKLNAVASQIVNSLLHFSPPQRLMNSRPLEMSRMWLLPVSWASQIYKYFRMYLQVVRERAAQAIMNIASKAVGPDKNDEAEAIGPLIRLLKGSTSEAVQWKAAAALFEIANGHLSNQAVIEKAGGIPLLLRMLQSDSEDLRLEGAKTLKVLAANDLVRERIGKEGAIPLLVKMQREFEAEAGRQEATAALLALAANKFNRKKLKKAGFAKSVPESQWPLAKM